MRYDNTAFAVPMRVGVFFGRSAVRRPARVSNAKVARQGFLAEQVFEIFELSRTAAHGKIAIAYDGNARGVVSAIFQRFQPAHDDWNGITRPNVAKYSTHVEKDSKSAQAA